MKVEKIWFVQFCIGCVLAHFIYQYFNGQNWSVAIERSYFQATAILSFLFLIWVVNFLTERKNDE